MILKYTIELLLYNKGRLRSRCICGANPKKSRNILITITILITCSDTPVICMRESHKKIDCVPVSDLHNSRVFREVYITLTFRFTRTSCSLMKQFAWMYVSRMTSKYLYLHKVRALFKRFILRP